MLKKAKIANRSADKQNADTRHRCTEDPKQSRCVRLQCTVQPREFTQFTVPLIIHVGLFALLGLFLFVLSNSSVWLELQCLLLSDICAPNTLTLQNAQTHASIEVLHYSKAAALLCSPAAVMLSFFSSTSVCRRTTAKQPLQLEYVRSILIFPFLYCCAQLVCYFFCLLHFVRRYYKVYIRVSQKKMSFSYF